MKQQILKITENTPVTDSVYTMKLEGQGSFKLFSITRILEVGSDK